MKYLFVYFGKFLHFMFPLGVIKYFKKIKRAINTGYYGQTLKSIGRNSSIDYPVTNLLGGKYISLGDSVFVGKYSILAAWDSHFNETFTPEIVIGNNVAIGDDCFFTAINKIVIGNNVLFGRKVTITDNSHGKNILDESSIPPIERKLFSKGPVIIKDRVWIGDKVTILPGVTIGENSVVGANSVVTKNVPDNSIVAGVPAKIIFKIGEKTI